MGCLGGLSGEAARRERDDFLGLIDHQSQQVAELQKREAEQQREIASLRSAAAANQAESRRLELDVQAARIEASGLASDKEARACARTGSGWALNRCRPFALCASGA